MAANKAKGFTLAEILVVLVVIGIITRAVIPMISFQTTKLDVAAEEIANAVRLAMSEAARTGAYVLIDARTSAGHLMLLSSDAQGTSGAPYNDPLTRRPLDIVVTGERFSEEVTMTPNFVAAGRAYQQLLVGPGGLRVFDGATFDMGPLEAGSGIVLAHQSRTLTVTIDEVTRRVALP